MSQPRRRTTAQAVRRQLLVFTEGEKTEPQYLKAWERLRRDRVIVTIANDHGTPLTLVNAAVKAKLDDDRDARRGKGAPYDAVWCVFDCDEHPSIDEATALAAAHGVQVAFSNPCVELWFVLHFEEQTAWIDRRSAQRRSRELLGCDKALSRDAIDALLARHADASTRARKLDEMHQGDGRAAGANPSTAIWRLVDDVGR